VETFFERFAAEVDQQSDRQMHQTDVGEELLAVDGSQLLDGFYTLHGQ
jgi:hypothetical protein